jgi:hypothetical protein
MFALFLGAICRTEVADILLSFIIEIEEGTTLGELLSHMSDMTQLIKNIIFFLTLMLKRVTNKTLVSEIPFKIQNCEHKAAPKGIHVRAYLQVFSIKNSLSQNEKAIFKSL